MRLTLIDYSWAVGTASRATGRHAAARRSTARPRAAGPPGSIADRFGARATLDPEGEVWARAYSDDSARAGARGPG